MYSYLHLIWCYFLLWLSRCGRFQLVCHAWSSTCSDTSDHTFESKSPLELFSSLETKPEIFELNLPWANDVVNYTKEKTFHSHLTNSPNRGSGQSQAWVSQNLSDSSSRSFDRATCLTWLPRTRCRRRTAVGTGTIFEILSLSRSIMQVRQHEYLHSQQNQSHPFDANYLLFLAWIFVAKIDRSYEIAWSACCSSQWSLSRLSLLETFYFTKSKNVRICFVMFDSMRDMKLNSRFTEICIEPREWHCSPWARAPHWSRRTSPCSQLSDTRPSWFQPWVSPPSFCKSKEKRCQSWYTQILEAN